MIIFTIPKDAVLWYSLWEITYGCEGIPMKS